MQTESQPRPFLKELFKDGIVVGIVGMVVGVVGSSAVIFRAGLGIAAGSAVGEVLTQK